MKTNKKISIALIAILIAALIGCITAFANDEHTHNYEVKEHISSTCQNVGYDIMECSCGATYKRYYTPFEIKDANSNYTHSDNDTKADPIDVYLDFNQKYTDVSKGNGEIAEFEYTEQEIASYSIKLSDKTNLSHSTVFGIGSYSYLHIGNSDWAEKFEQCKTNQKDLTDYGYSNGTNIDGEIYRYYYNDSNFTSTRKTINGSKFYVYLDKNSADYYGYSIDSIIATPVVPEGVDVSDYELKECTSDGAVKENIVEATCTTAGSYDSVEYCKYCGKEISRETIDVPALGHNITRTKVNPTCTTDGYDVLTCSRCDYNEIYHKTSFTIDSNKYPYPEAKYKVDDSLKSQTFTYDGADKDNIDHLAITFSANTSCWDAGGIEWAADSGYISIYESSGNFVSNYALDSTLSGKFYKTVLAGQTINVSGTSFTITISDTDADYYGYSIDSIVAVPKTDTRGYPALGHKYTASVVAPTCEKQGYTLNKCIRCDDSYNTKYTNALGHYYQFNKKDGTYLQYKCNVCDDIALAKPEWDKQYINNYTKRGDDICLLDLNNDGIVNAKDYAKLKKLMK